MNNKNDSISILTTREIFIKKTGKSSDKNTNRNMKYHMQYPHFNYIRISCNGGLLLNKHQCRERRSNSHSRSHNVYGLTSLSSQNIWRHLAQHRLLTQMYN